MRVTKGSFVRRWVYDVRHGREQVRRVMYGRRQVWPANEVRVATVALDLVLPDGSLDGAFWQHAMRAVEAGSSEVCHVRVTAGSRVFNLQSTYGVWNVCSLVRGVLDFGSKGPLVQELRVGDEVVLEAVIPQHEGVRVGAGENADSEGLTGLPWLPGTCLRVQVSKGRKKVSAGCRFELQGVPSGRVYVQGYAQKDGHCRGTYWGDAYAKGMRVINGRVERYEDEFAFGDTGVKLAADWYNFGSGVAYPVFPGFKRVWRFKVTALTVREFKV